MATIYHPKYLRVVKTPSKFPTAFLNAAGAPAAATAAVTASVPDFMTFKNSHINKVIVNRFTALQRPVLTVDAAQAAQVAVAGAIVANTIVSVEFRLQAIERVAEFSNGEYLYGMTEKYQVVLQPGDNAGNFLFKLYQAMRKPTGKNHDFRLYSEVGTGGTLGADTLDLLEIRVLRDFVFVTDIKAVGFDDLPSTAVTTFAPVTAIPLVSPINRGKELEFREKMQNRNNQPYLPDFEEIPFDSEAYTHVHIEWAAGRKDPLDPNMSDTMRYDIFFLESSCAALIQEWAEFLLTNTATKFPNLRPNGISVGFNSILALTNGAAASTATNLNSAHGVATPYFGTLAGTNDKYIFAESIVNDDTLDNFMLARVVANV